MSCRCAPARREVYWRSNVSNGVSPKSAFSSLNEPLRLENILTAFLRGARRAAEPRGVRPPNDGLVIMTYLTAQAPLPMTGHVRQRQEGV
jgi:hypothetical protein